MTLDEATELVTAELGAEVVDPAFWSTVESAGQYVPPEEPYRYLTGDARD